MAQAESQANQPCILVADEGWHEGVIGIVAGRLKEQFSRPAFVMSIQHGKAKGSARSVPGADIGAAVTSARLEGLLLAGGGHAMAAGFSLDVAQLDAFRDYINTRLERAVSDYHLGRHLRYDGMASVGALGLAMIDALDQAGPYGMGNPSPRIVIPDVRLLQCERMKSAHLRLLLADAAGGKARLKAVCFNVVDTPLGLALESWAARMPEKAIYLAGQLKRNRWNGYESAQFLIDDAMII